MFSQIHRSLADDDRAIDGIPIRLVVALIVGVVTLGIVMQILRGIDTFDSDTEVDVEFDLQRTMIQTPSACTSLMQTGTTTDARGIATAGDARMHGAIGGHTGEASNEATFTFEEENVRLTPDLAVGTAELEVQPPTGSLESQGP